MICDILTIMSAPWSSVTYRIDTTVNRIPASTIDYTPLTIPCHVEEVMKEGKRWYLSNGVYYPSITTLISATDREGTKALNTWRRSVGHTQASHITRQAAARGIQWHTFCEQFVSGQTPHWSLLTNPSDLSYASNVGQVLNTRIFAVLASETRVVSALYGVAGRMDLCVLLQDGRRAILDFKTGKKEKTGNRLVNYAMQATFYADALTEQVSSTTIDTIVIVQLLPDKIVWQESSPVLWRNVLRERITDYAAVLNEQLV